MKSFKRTATISKRSPGILLRVPRRCTNGTEEVFHRRFIAIEQLAVEVTRVPIDYHTPQIEDCDTIFCHCKYILSFLRESSYAHLIPGQKSGCCLWLGERGALRGKREAY